MATDSVVTNQSPQSVCDLQLELIDVPSRYVTGYVVVELEGEYGDYWLARNRNAHAWAEAYDDDRRRWLSVEATPGMSLPRDEAIQADATTGSGQSDAWRTGDLTTEYPWLDKRWLSSRWASVGNRLKYPLLLPEMINGCAA